VLLKNLAKLALRALNLAAGQKAAANAAFTMMDSCKAVNKFSLTRKVGGRPPQ